MVAILLIVTSASLADPVDQMTRNQLENTVRNLRDENRKLHKALASMTTERDGLARELAERSRQLERWEPHPSTMASHHTPRSAPSSDPALTELQKAEIRLQEAEAKLRAVEAEREGLVTEWVRKTNPSLKSAVATPWTLVETTTVSGTISGTITKGHILRTHSGNIYVVTGHTYLYTYLFSPSVTVMTNSIIHKLLIDGLEESLLCRRLGGVNGIQSFIESRITSDFDGFEYDNVYHLASGQVWQQTSFDMSMNLCLSPEVIIWSEGLRYTMKVEGVEGTVTVRRLR
ncbi:MAG: hypothetical protein GY842_06915 [bacterium]|nr:hypothetical protein [bacterium]